VSKLLQATPGATWPSPECVCNAHWQQAFTREAVLEFSRDRWVLEGRFGRSWAGCVLRCALYMSGDVGSLAMCMFARVMCSYGQVLAECGCDLDSICRNTS
jgi:hypothetical protein